LWRSRTEEEAKQKRRCHNNLTAGNDNAETTLRSDRSQPVALRVSGIARNKSLEETGGDELMEGVEQD